VKHLKQHAPWYLVALLIAANVLIYYAIAVEKKSALTVAFLDIGQGDAIFIESPTGTQVLVDGGPNASVLRELGRVMPFYDRSIDMLIVTNPDQDHFAGFLDVLERYEVARVLEPGTVGASDLYAELQKAIKNEETTHSLARRGQVIDLGGGTYLKILFPDRDVAGLSPNDGSIVMQLIYGETEILLTGDTTARIEEYLVSLEGEALQSDVLKVAHHGSRTSTSPLFVAEVSPKYAVISNGKDNRYGHPHQETLDTLEKIGATVFRTDEYGTIILTSDGERVEVR
jgi:competence protein ComEC